MSHLINDRWQLPDGVDELLPDAAWHVEQLRRRIVDCCRCAGFNLVMPPMVEYLDSLLTGTGETMDLQTFKLVDQQNGRSLGVRADMTPQVARMDAHALRSEQPNRLFYTGTVLRARTDGFGGSRSPLQFGAELFGHEGGDSDVEVVRLMLATLEQADLKDSNLLLDIGHVGIYRGLLDQLHLDDESADNLFNAFQRGSLPDVRALLSAITTDSACTAEQVSAAAMLEALMQMRGNPELLSRAAQTFATASADVRNAINSLQNVVDGVLATHPELSINIDLAELRGYRYHTGVLFAAYTSDGVELARGGRYDAVGAAFGHPRPATGFSGDLKKLAELMPVAKAGGDGIFVASASVNAAWSEIVRLRSKGERVITELSHGGNAPPTTDCDRQLVLRDNQWTIEPITVHEQS